MATYKITRMTRDMICEEQEARQALFPPDRIAFTFRAASDDLAALKAWAEGRITFDLLRATIARNNYLDRYFENGMIPEAMMRSELKHTGWRRPE